MANKRGIWSGGKFHMPGDKSYAKAVRARGGKEKILKEKQARALSKEATGIRKEIKATKARIEEIKRIEAFKKNETKIRNKNFNEKLKKIEKLKKAAARKQDRIKRGEIPVKNKISKATKAKANNTKNMFTEKELASVKLINEGFKKQGEGAYKAPKPPKR